MAEIKRINKIQNIGIFDDFVWPTVPKDLVFNRINLLFGYNGSGKTTLSNIIGLFADDLEDIDKNTIAKDMASDPDKPICIDMLCDEKNLKFPNGRSKIFVFNSTFVANHVFDGRVEKVTRFKNDVVTNENVSSPVVKRIDKEIKNEVSRKEKIQAYQEELKNLADEIKKDLSSTWNSNIDTSRMPQGLNLERCPEAASEESEEELRNSLEDQFSKFKISKDQGQLDEDIAFLRQIPRFELNFPKDLKEMLKKHISENARDKVQQKIESFKSQTLRHTTLQNWFDDGSTLLKLSQDNAICPLCDSFIPEINNIISSYQDFFNDELEELNRKIVAAIKIIDVFLQISERRRDEVKTLKILLFRYGYQDSISASEGEVFFRLENQAIKSKLENTKKVLKTKEGSIGYIPKQKDLDVANSLLSDCERFGNDIEILLAFRESVLKSLLDARFDDVAAKEVARKLFWKRFDVQGGIKANEWFEEENLKQEYLRIGIKKYISGITLHHYLKEMMDLVGQGIFKKGEEKASEISKLKRESEYVNLFLDRLCVRNFKINTESEGEITIHYEGVKPRKGIEYSLSEGEKTALAFAYFLSKYQYEVLDNTNVRDSDYTIVVDDPVSSLDENRLFSTALIIEELLVPKIINKGGNGKPAQSKGNTQIFIFSHNIIFLKFMGNILDSKQNKCRTDFYLEKGVLSLLPGTLANYQTSYFYKLSKIRSFVEGNAEYETAKDFLPNYIRVVLEAFLSFKFSKLSSSTNDYQPAMLGGLIKYLDGYSEKFHAFEAVGNISCKDTLKLTLRHIKEKTNPESHGTVQDVTHVEYLSESELLDTANQTLNVIQFLDQIHYEKLSSLG